VRATIVRIAAVAACACAVAAPGASSAWSPFFVVRASAKRVDVGGYRIWGLSAGTQGPTYAAAIAVYGPATTCTFGYGKSDALVRWTSIGVTAEFATLGVFSKGGNACRSPREVYLDHLTVTDKRWWTLRDLRIGDPVTKVLRLYPGAVAHGDSYWLIVTRNPAVGVRPLFAAAARRGHVTAFTFIIQAQGE